MINYINLRILQWNCRGLRGKTYELERFATEWDIIMLVETFLKPEQNDFHVNGFETVRFDRLDNNRGGIAFLVKKDLIFDTIHLDFNPSSLEVGSISVSTSRGYISLTACYRSPIGNNNLSLYEWQNFLEAVKK